MRAISYFLNINTRMLRVFLKPLALGDTNVVKTNTLQCTDKAKNNTFSQQPSEVHD